MKVQREVLGILYDAESRSVGVWDGVSCPGICYRVRHVSVTLKCNKRVLQASTSVQSHGCNNRDADTPPMTQVTYNTITPPMTQVTYNTITPPMSQVTYNTITPPMTQVTYNTITSVQSHGCNNRDADTPPMTQVTYNTITPPMTQVTYNIITPPMTQVTYNTNYSTMGTRRTSEVKKKMGW